MLNKHYPSINMSATGMHIKELREARGLTVKDLQSYFGFEAPQAIYKWQKGDALPSVDNLLALSTLLEVPMESILVWSAASEPSGSVFLCSKTVSRLTRYVRCDKNIGIWNNNRRWNV